MENRQQVRTHATQFTPQRRVTAGEDRGGYESSPWNKGHWHGKGIMGLQENSRPPPFTLSNL